jgi:hypothetical protein
VKLEPQATQDPTVRGWLELGAMASTRSSLLTGAAEAAQWRARYPGHSRHGAARPGARAAPLAGIGGARHVALLLPLTGAPASPPPRCAMVSRRRSACCRRSCGRKSRSTTPGALPVPDAIDQARSAGV